MTNGGLQFCYTKLKLYSPAFFYRLPSLCLFNSLSKKHFAWDGPDLQLRSCENNTHFLLNERKTDSLSSLPSPITVCIVTCTPDLVNFGAMRTYFIMAIIRDR